MVTQLKQQDVTQNVKNIRSQAVAKHKGGQIEEAITLYLESIELQEDHPAWVYGNTITLLTQVNRADQGLTLKEQALKNCPNSAEIYRAIGVAFYQEHDWENSISHYLKSLDISKDQPNWLYSSLVEMLVANNKLEQAIKIGKLGLECHSDFAWLNYHLAEALFQKKKWQAAIAYYRKAAQCQPSIANLQSKIDQINENIIEEESKLLEEKSRNLATKAIERHKEGKLEEAITLYLESIELEEAQPAWVYGNLITLLAQEGRLDEGLSYQEKALSNNPESDEIYRALGLAFNQKGDLESSIDCYRKALDINTEQPNWLYSCMVEMLVANRQLSQAIEISSLGLELYPDFAWLKYHLAGAFAEEGNWESALNYYHQAAQSQPDLPNIQAKIAHANYQNQDDKNGDRESKLSHQKASDYQVKAISKHKDGLVEEAIHFYLKSIDTEEQRPAWVYGNVITLLTQTKSLDQAIEIGLKAEQLHPQADEIYRAQALLFTEKKDINNTILLYQKAFELNPEQPDWCYLNFAQNLLQTEQIKKAFEITIQGLKYYPKYYYLNYIQAQVFAAQQRWDDAIASYVYIQKQNPNWLEAEEGLTQAVYQKNKLERANNNSEAEKVKFFWLNSKATDEIDVPTNNNQFKIEKFDNLDVNFLFRQIQSSELTLREFQDICKLKAKYSFKVNYSCFLSNRVLYFEALNDNVAFKEDVEILIAGKCEYLITKAQIFQITDYKILGIAYLREDIILEVNQDCNIYINNQNQLLASNEFKLQRSYNLEFIEHLNSKPDSQKQFIREKISSFLINIDFQNSNKEELSNVLHKLQYFLDINPVNIAKFNIPFHIAIDNVISLENKSLFISGWMQDRYNMIQGIKVISSLGFTWDISPQNILKLERRDLRNCLQDTEYSDFQSSSGFVVYVPIPSEIYESISEWNEFHSFRFLVMLKGDIEISIIPESKYQDLEVARTEVINIADSNKVSETILEECLAPVALKLQQLLMAQVKIKGVTLIGKPVENPLVSIIIPLYRRLDFLKVQFAAIANDPAMKQCELIYVLDSPEQESEVIDFLHDHCNLYELAVTLIVMEKNSGYASANNAGASQAKGKYLLLLNSDVFPKVDGWALAMAEFYAKSPQIGVLGAKLLYEDNSLQHAGLSFENTSFPFWNISHSYKGLPENYELAHENRAVNAVTGACLMIDKALYEEVGGLTTDYIIGCFEDSDLCLKCLALGYETWYLADVTLYHVERQSIHLHEAYKGSLAWHLNGYLHHKRWKEQIEKLIDCE